MKKKNELNKDDENKIAKIENKLIQVRKKRVKPFFDDKSQTDLNSFLLDTLINSSIVLEDDNLKKDVLNSLKTLNEKLSKKIYHCYDSGEIDVFLEDYVYYAMLLITLYEVDCDEHSLNKSKTIMKEIWEIFYNKDTQLLQKNRIKDNDLFVNPIDLNDSNIPNGNSIYLNLCNKLYLITNDKFWIEKTQILKKSFHQVLNSFYSQMFSFIKTLDIIEDSLSFTFYGDDAQYEEIKKKLLQSFLGRATFIYKKENNSNSGVVICSEQTCSNKISGIKEINAYLNEQGIK